MATPNRRHSANEETPPPRQGPGLAARGAALDVLRTIRGGRSLDDALNRTRTFNALDDPSDRAFSRALVMTVLRRRNSLDALYERFLDRPLKPAQYELRDLLRLAAAQVCLLEVPAHAVASTAVDLAKERRETAGFRGLVNALCRRLAALPKNTLETIPVREDTPGWLWRILARAYGAATAARIVAVHRQEPPLDVTARNIAERATLAKTLGGVPVGSASIRLQKAGAVEHLEGWRDGTFWVQDVAASLPVMLLGPLEDRTAIDLCAAPGGKTLQMAAAGARVTAVDISDPRLDRLRENLDRTGLTASIVVSDALEFSPDAPAQAVLLDAPCTATGTIRRHPDLLWSKKETDAVALSSLQDRMLERAASMVAPGGCLVFATCSLLPIEGEERAKAFLSRHEAFTLDPVRPEEISGLPCVSKEGFLRTLPSNLGDEGGMDGFFAARFRRSGG